MANVIEPGCKGCTIQQYLTCPRTNVNKIVQSLVIPENCRFYPVFFVLFFFGGGEGLLFCFVFVLVFFFLVGGCLVHVYKPTQML